MKTVGTRELKQNPHAVIQRVVETGEEYEITSYGRPTGARIVADRPPRRWVRGDDLAGFHPINASNAARWQADVDEALTDEVGDPWEQS